MDETENSFNTVNTSRKSIGGTLKKVAFTEESISLKNRESVVCNQTVKRVSFSLRGKRKSSFNDIQASIHPDIDPEDFHKHVNSSLPDPLRLRQIIVYAIDHYLAVNNKKTAAVVKEELNLLIKLLLEKSVSTSWFSRPRSGNEGLVVSLPNPANSELQARINGYRELVHKLNKKNEELISACEYKPCEYPDILVEDQESSILPQMPNLDPKATEISCKELKQRLCEIDNFTKRHTKILNSQFIQAIETCWDDQEDQQQQRQLMEPFALKYAKAGRRLSFNIQKSDECVKILRALSVTK